jgi:divinyl protochlorophyllide a 8-vinyl-reductase
MAVAGRIGPNALTRMAEALQVALGPGPAQELLAACGLPRLLDSPPAAMVDEEVVRRLHRAVADALDPATAEAVARDAGLRTAAYILAHRIPTPARLVMRALPPGMAAMLLVAAIRRHAWTFAGSGRFRTEPGRPLRLVLEDCPLCRGVRAQRPACGYFAATFEGLFAALVSRAATVREIDCAAMGASACRFEVRR